MTPLTIPYNSPRGLKAFLEEQGLGAHKRLGQNFLINGDARTRLIDALGIRPGDEVWEIGPGLGAMTGELLDRGAQVTAFEIDSGFARVLGRLLGSRAGFTLVKGDALATWRGAGSARFLLGNLPYTIGARLLGLFIQEQRFFTRMVVMVQREVAARMTACAGSKDYASFSVLCASAYTVTPLIRLKGASFYPVPQVESQALRLDLKGGAACYPPAFYPLVRRLFLSRRKTLKNNLQCLLDSGIIKDTQGKDAGAALERCGIDGNRRPETLCLDEFTALARELEEESWG